MKKNINIPNMYIVQKESDKYHYEEQYLPFLNSLNGLSLNKKILITEEIGISIDNSGHKPLTYESMKERIEFMFKIINRVKD